MYSTSADPAHSLGHLELARPVASDVKFSLTEIFKQSDGTESSEEIGGYRIPSRKLLGRKEVLVGAAVYANCIPWPNAVHARNRSASVMINLSLPHGKCHHGTRKGFLSRHGSQFDRQARSGTSGARQVEKMAPTMRSVST